MTQVEAARLFGVTRRAVSKWMKQTRQGSLRSLKAKRQGRPKGGRLNARQAQRIRRLIIDQRPDQLKLPFYLWTREAVAQLIEREYGIRLSVWTVGRSLAAWSITPQKPIRRAFERNSVQVGRWSEVLGVSLGSPESENRR